MPGAWESNTSRISGCSPRLGHLRLGDPRPPVAVGGDVEDASPCSAPPSPRPRLRVRRRSSWRGPYPSVWNPPSCGLWCGGPGCGVGTCAAVSTDASTASAPASAMSCCDSPDRVRSSGARPISPSGRVRSLHEDGNVLAGVVEGSEAYRVEVHRGGRGRSELIAACTCPHGADGRFCKHAVAVALAGLEERDSREDEEGMRGWLERQRHGLLVDLLAEAAPEDPSLAARLAAGASWTPRGRRRRARRPSAVGAASGAGSVRRRPDRGGRRGRCDLDADAAALPAAQRGRVGRPPRRPRRRPSLDVRRARRARAACGRRAARDARGSPTATGSPRCCPTSPRRWSCTTRCPGAGGVLVPLNTRLAADDYAYILGHAEPRAIVAHPSRREVLETALARMEGEVPQVIWDDGEYDAAARGPASRRSCATPTTSARSSRSTTPRARPAARRAS